MVLLIAYNDANAGRCIFRPTEEAYAAISEGRKTIHDVASFVVPTGRPYAVVDSDGLPVDWADRDSLFLDENRLTDGVGGAEGVAAEGLFVPRNNEPAPTRSKKKKPDSGPFKLKKENL